MSSEIEQDQTMEQEQASPEPGMADDGDSAFVAESKSPMSTASVLMFLVLSAGAAGIYFMHSRTSLKPKPTAESAAATTTINRFLTDGGRDLKAMQEMLRNTQLVVAQFAAFPAATQVPLSDLRTNPFRIGGLNPAAAQDAELAARKKREEQRAAVLKSVQALQLQSIVYGDARRACMINGTLYAEGQEVNGFSIEKISQVSVIVNSGQYRFELKMKR